MHRLSSGRSVFALRFGSVLLLLVSTSLIVSIGGIAYGFYKNAPDLAEKGLYGLFATLGLLLLQKYFAHSAYCPLCRGPVLRGSRAQRHRNASRTFWSYRLRVARDIVLTNKFSCPYCGERTNCVVRKRPPG